MLFAIDIGNSHTVIGLFKGDELIGQWRFKSEKEQTDDELAIRVHGLLSLIGIAAADITGIVIASVVPALQTAWISSCRKYLSANLLSPLLAISAASIKESMEIRTESPEEVGADRLVNGIAAWHQYRCPLVVIDFGTAITFDCVSAECEYLGGAILPGIAISLDALSSRTAKLPRIDIATGPKKVIGANTVEAMKSGILHGHGALVDGMTGRIGREMGCRQGELKVIATGGMAHLIAPYAQSINVIEPMLTLHGLQILHARQQKNG